MDTATLKEEGVDIATAEITNVDIATAEITNVDTTTSKRRYSDGKFILLPISHQKVWNVENLRGKTRAFVIVVRDQYS